MRKIASAAAVAALALSALLATAPGSGADGQEAKAKIRSAAGGTLATVKLEQGADGVTIKVSASGLTPGFHGFHVHTTGTCTKPDGTPDFALAGGHYAGSDPRHGDHAGDLPSLLVRDDGRAALRFVTDAFTVTELLGGDGSAFIIHAGRDNYANIDSRYVSQDPAQTGAAYQTFTGTTYANGPDLATLKTGDAGGRTGCGVIVAD